MYRHLLFFLNFSTIFSMKNFHKLFVYVLSMFRDGMSLIMRNIRNEFRQTALDYEMLRKILKTQKKKFKMNIFSLFANFFVALN